jgi:D-cysteine desulfhydrase
MVDRMVGAQIHLVGDEEFAQEGGWKLVCALRDKLVRKDRKPYCFPSGGSNDVGTWGYVEAIHELQQQAEAATVHLDRIYFACGSGGTAAGLALGLLWSGLAEAGTELVGLGVDDTPDDFYAKLDGIFQEMQVPKGTPPARKLLRIEQRIGEGYAKSTHAELEYIVEVARATGVVLDPVYSGKAALGMVEDLQARTCDRAVFIHTGGLLGLYAKEEQLGSLISGGWHSFTRE